MGYTSVVTSASQSDRLSNAVEKGAMSVAAVRPSVRLSVAVRLTDGE